MYACSQSAGWLDGHYQPISLQEHYLHKCLDVFIKEKNLYLDGHFTLNPYAVPYKPQQRKKSDNEILPEVSDAGTPKTKNNGGQAKVTKTEDDINLKTTDTRKDQEWHKPKKTVPNHSRRNGHQKQITINHDINRFSMLNDEEEQDEESESDSDSESVTTSSSYSEGSYGNEILADEDNFDEENSDNINDDTKTEEDKDAITKKDNEAQTVSGITREDLAEKLRI